MPTRGAVYTLRWPLLVLSATLGVLVVVSFWVGITFQIPLDDVIDRTPMLAFVNSCVEVAYKERQPTEWIIWNRLDDLYKFRLHLLWEVEVRPGWRGATTIAPGWPLVALPALLAFFGFRRARAARLHGRCHECGYAMRDSSRCPECGRLANGLE